jgi:hypothetical protein
MLHPCYIKTLDLRRHHAHKAAKYGTIFMRFFLCFKFNVLEGITKLCFII